jgi:hypothetical protein
MGLEGKSVTEPSAFKGMVSKVWALDSSTSITRNLQKCKFSGPTKIS